MKLQPYTPLDFKEIEKQAQKLASIILDKYDELVKILVRYESHEVAVDEIARTLDLLNNLSENKDYFRIRIGAITTFLPRNQPLYAFTCFIVVPSLMSSEVYFRVPHTMHGFLPDVLALLDIFTLFPNIVVSKQERLDFLRDRSAILKDPVTKDTHPITETVIFTGTSVHADQLRLVFDTRTLFITNGAGHNPIVVGNNADLENAAEAVLKLSLYNQGQDCAAPNSILVHSEIYDEFTNVFFKKFSEIKIGQYNDHTCNVGPISNPDDLKRITSIIVDNREWLHPETKGVIRIDDSILEPTIIMKPLSEGGNFDESFAPIIFIQKYEKDDDLATYFEDPRYAPNAMYVTLYGTSKYVENMIGRPIKGKILHYKDTFLHNKHLHEPGVERGVKPYGGYGRGASSLSINSRTLSIPTLPQRDIFEWVAEPILKAQELNEFNFDFEKFTEVEYKNVEKILRLKTVVTRNNDNRINEFSYFDLGLIKDSKNRYVKIEDNHIHTLINQPNIEYIRTLSMDDLRLIRTLKFTLEKKADLTLSEFQTLIYAIPKDPNESGDTNKANQLRFFQNVYWLLFNRNHGPKLATFLWELEGDIVYKLLDV